MLCIVLLFLGFAVINPIFNKKTYKIYLLLFAVALACLAWFTKPDYTMDLSRAYGQLDLYGKTAASSTEGLEIYAFNVWYNKGQEGSR